MATATKPTGSQFDSLLAPRKRTQVAEPDSTPEATDDAAPKSQPSATKSNGKAQKAKSKDDAYQGRTFYVRKKTYVKCSHQLESNDDRRDMSDLAEELLTAWLAKPDIKPITR